MKSIEETITNNKELMSQIVAVASGVAAEVATKQAIQEYEKRKVVIQEEQQNKKLHNVETLLNNYIALKEYVKRIDKKAKASLPEEIIMKETESLIKLLEFSNDIVGTIKEQSQKSIVMVQHMDSALDALKYIYTQENNERDFNILEKRYIKRMNATEIGDYYEMSRRNIQKILSRARMRYSVLLFGIYGVKLEKE